MWPPNGFSTASGRDRQISRTRATAFSSPTTPSLSPAPRRAASGRRPYRPSMAVPERHGVRRFVVLSGGRITP
ncbi:hypothetical protein Mame01_60770 [Microbispora amethystogenes]|nr:hypothetical protein Mame01_60770 [Microbispora amethystogenes]